MRWLFALALLGSAAGIAYADNEPWAEGVPKDKQDAALALYKEGNEFFARDQFKEALDKYAQALAIYDHPAIRYNAAVCLINMDRPVEAYEDLEAALRFGEAPLGSDLYKQGLSYRKLLAGRIAEVDVTTKVPATQVTLDGQPVLGDAGTTSRHVLTGDHQIVAEKPGYQTETKPVHVNAGDRVTIVIDLHPIEKQGELHRRFPKWVPWAVLGAGGAIALAGLPLLLEAQSSFNHYDDGVSQACQAGCPPASLPSEYANDLSHGKLLRVLGYSSFAVGGALVASTFALMAINQPHLVAPMVSGDTVGLVVSGSW
jgi:tetratricopeptide (TPR) repeat protein